MATLQKRVTVLSAGAGGCALSFHLTQAGYEVLLYQDENHTKSIEVLMKTNQIIALREYDGYQAPLHGSIQVNIVTTNIKEALQFSKILIMVVPAFGQMKIFKSALPYLTKDHIFVSMPGNFAIFDYIMGIRQQQKVKPKGWNALTYIEGLPVPCVFVETSIIPYACRRLQNNELFIGGVKQFIHVGIFPQSKTESTLCELREIFHNLNIRLEKKHILEVAFYNSNIILHPSITIYNAGHIKHMNKGFRFYKDGVSPLVMKIILELDNERKEIAKSVGFKVENFSSFYKRFYGDKSERSLLNFLQESEFLHFVKAPTDLSGRFISEDLQYVLIPIIENIARVKGINTPVADAIISSARCMVGNEIPPLRHICTELWDAIKE